MAGIGEAAAVLGTAAALDSIISLNREVVESLRQLKKLPHDAKQLEDVLVNCLNVLEQASSYFRDYTIQTPPGFDVSLRQMSDRIMEIKSILDRVWSTKPSLFDVSLAGAARRTMDIAKQYQIACSMLVNTISISISVNVREASETLSRRIPELQLAASNAQAGLQTAITKNLGTGWSLRALQQVLAVDANTKSRILSVTSYADDTTHPLRHDDHKTASVGLAQLQAYAESVHPNQSVEVDDDSIADWIKQKVKHIPEDKGTSIHLIFCPSGGAKGSSDLTVSLSLASFQSVVRQLNLPSAMISALSLAVPRTELWTSNKGTFTEGLILRAPVSSPQAQENWALGLSWTSDHQHAFGIVVGAREEDRAWVQTNLEPLCDLQHVLCIPLRLMEAVLQRDIVELQRHGHSLFDVETSTRLYIWSDDVSNESSSDMDFDKFTKTLNGVVSRLAFQEMRLGGFTVTLDKLEACSREMKSGSKRDNSQLRREINRLREQTKSMLHIVAYHQRVAQSLVEVVYTMISQSDNRISRQQNLDNMTLTQASVAIANASKKDSSAMKTLAVVSTVFLPGTFISALFSMSMFRWDAPPGNKVVSDRFWVYWAITIPTTIVVVIAFQFFVWSHIEPGNHKRVETPFQGLKRRRTENVTEKGGHLKGFGTMFRRRRSAQPPTDEQC